MSKSIVGGMRKLDDLGRVVIPSEVRKELNLTIGEQMMVEVEDGAIVIRPYKKICRCCGDPANITILDYSFCESCAKVHKKYLNKILKED